MCLTLLTREIRHLDFRLYCKEVLYSMRKSSYRRVYGYNAGLFVDIPR